MNHRLKELLSTGVKIVNPDDFEVNFWGHNYQVILDRFTSVIVNAEHDQAAIDYAIDYAEENIPNLLLDENDIQEIIQEHGEDGLQDYICGGNHSRYIAEMGATVFEQF